MGLDIKSVNSREEYSELVYSAKHNKSGLLSNSYMYSTSVDRLINQKRMHYSLSDRGLFFFEDEIEYCNLVFFITADSEIPSFNLDKPLIIRLLSRRGKEESLSRVKKQIKTSGYEHKGKYVNVQGDPQEILGKLDEVAPKAEQYLERFGIDIVNPDIDTIRNIREMQYMIDSIPFYDIEYRTDEEMQKASEEGYLLAAIKRDSKELCGANYSILNGRYVTGWIAILDKFRDVPGISVCLHKRAVERDARNDHVKKTWISTDNKDSLIYHERIGFKYTGEEMDVWLLNSGKGNNNG